jgi:hypothetical protein
MTLYGGHTRPPEGFTGDPLLLWPCSGMGGLGTRAIPGRELSTSSTAASSNAESSDGALLDELPYRALDYLKSTLARIVRCQKTQRNRRGLPTRVVPAWLLTARVVVIPALQRHMH